MQKHQFIIVGGGAGGLELATRLAKRWGAHRGQPKALITLVDSNPVHVWKPLLHEVAAGSIEVATHQLEYTAQAQLSGFSFQQGALKGLNRAEHRITLANVVDDNDVECFPERTLHYDTLILAIGSVTNFFNVTGAESYSFSLDDVHQAEYLRRRLITACLKTQESTQKTPLHITIVGGGATGVELAAELKHTIQILGTYGIHQLDLKQDVCITIVEAAPRILLALSERTAKATVALLNKLAITVKTDAFVTEVTQNAVHLKNGESIPSDFTIWAAGVKAPSILRTLNGLAVNAQNQVVVHATLQTKTDPDIFAMGDCASCPWLGHPQSISVPPRAQAVHQQANFLVKQLKHRLTGQTITKPFRYHDFGALVVLGHTSAVGNIQDGLTTRGLFVRGWIARWMYFSLYRMHIAALLGWRRMILDTIGQWLTGSTRPRVKLH